MPDSHSCLHLEELIHALRACIAHLRHLHVLSQTETLMLDQADYTGLSDVVKSKEALVTQMLEMRETVAHAMQQVDLEQTSGEWNQLLRSLSGEATRMIALVSDVDNRNRLRLESLRSVTIRSLHSLQHTRHLHQTYVVDRLEP